jgi:hypothetical protein
LLPTVDSVVVFAPFLNSTVVEFCRVPYSVRTRDSPRLTVEAVAIACKRTLLTSHFVARRSRVPLIVLTIYMRRRNPNDTNMMSHDYETVDTEVISDSSSKRGSICPRSYKSRRQLKVLAICIVAGLGLLGGARLFQLSGSSTQGKSVMSGGRLDRISSRDS